MLKKSTSGKTGFTFEEMLIVIAVLGVLASILINSMVRVDDETKYRKKTNIAQHIADKRNYANRMRGVLDTISIRLTDKDGKLVAPFNGFSAGDKITLTISQSNKWKCQKPNTDYYLRVYELYRVDNNRKPLFMYNFSIYHHKSFANVLGIYDVNKTVVAGTQLEALEKLKAVLDENLLYFPQIKEMKLLIEQGSQGFTSTTVKNVFPLPSHPTAETVPEPYELFYNLDENCSLGNCSDLPPIEAEEYNPWTGEDDYFYDFEDRGNPDYSPSASGLYDIVRKFNKLNVICEKETSPTDLVTVEFTLPDTSGANKFLNIRTYNKAWDRQMKERKAMKKGS